VFAAGSARPSSLSWIAQREALWLTGTDVDSAGTLVPVSGHSGTTYDSDDAILVFADRSGGLSRVSVTQNGVSASSWITADTLGGIALSATGGSPDIYVALADRPTSDGPASGTANTRIIRLHSK
jgi:hypothetical protein